MKALIPCVGDIFRPVGRKMQPAAFEKRLLAYQSAPEAVFFLTYGHR